MTDAATGRQRHAAPSRKAVDTVFGLFERGHSAVTQGRLLRAAEYFGRAAADARALWGDKGELCVVQAYLQQSNAVVAQAQGAAEADDAMPLWLEAHRLLVECRRILKARLSANTCLVGRCFAVEEDFCARYSILRLDSTVLDSSRGEEPPGQFSKRKARWSAKGGVKREVIYEFCMEAAFHGLRFAYPVFFARVRPGSTGGFPPSLSAEERQKAHAFALRCVGIIATATSITNGGFERPFAKLLRELLCSPLASNLLDPSFKTELTRLWHRPALQIALRHMFEGEEAANEIGKKIDDAFGKKAAADLAKHGLRWCALPFCAKQELHVFDFKQCSACKAVVYCSAEHAALHWTATHGKECASLKTAGVKPRSTADEGEGAAGGPGNDLEQPFKAEQTRALDRPVLQNAVRARGAFDEGDDEKEVGETRGKKGAADLAKHGLRCCALPSCAKQMTNVFDFKQCSACKAVVYCSAEHGALHWTRGHRKECAALKAAGAKPRVTADARTERLHAQAPPARAKTRKSADAGIGRLQAHVPQTVAKQTSTADAGTEWLHAHAPRAVVACAVVALAIGLVLIAGSVTPRAAAALG